MELTEEQIIEKVKEGQYKKLKPTDRVRALELLEEKKLNIGDFYT